MAAIHLNSSSLVNSNKFCRNSRRIFLRNSSENLQVPDEFLKLFTACQSLITGIAKLNVRSSRIMLTSGVGTVARLFNIGLGKYLPLVFSLERSENGRYRIPEPFYDFGIADLQYVRTCLRFTLK